MNYIAGVGALDLISFEALASFFAITALSWIVLAIAKIRGLRWRWFIAAAILPLALTTAAAANAVNAYFQYLPTAGDVLQAMTGDRQWPALHDVLTMPPDAAAARYPRGATTKLDVPADPANGFDATTAIVYVPQAYFADPAQPMPVTYLFHGSPGKPADWFHGGRAASAARHAADDGRPTIVVAPQMSKSWTDDPECVDGTHEKVESHLMQRVIPEVDRTLRTQPDRAGRIFAGMSAGGYCALNLGLRHRDDVGTIIDMSGFTGPTHGGGMDALFGRDGPVTTQLAAQNSPADYASTLSPDPSMRIWLDCGLSDPEVLTQMRAVLPSFQQLGFDVQLHTRPGSHTYEVWRPALAEALRWAVPTG